MSNEIIQWNIRGLKTSQNINFSKKIEIVTSFLLNPQSSFVINIQETHFTNQTQIPKDWLNFKHLYHIISTFAHERDRFSGISIFLNKTYDILEVKEIRQGRILLLNVQNKVSLKKIYVFSVYGKASGSESEKSEILKQILSHIETFRDQSKLIIIGDFNFVDSTLDRNTNCLNRTDKVCKEIWAKIENAGNLTDSFRITNKTKRLYTYFSATKHKSRIDKIFVPTEWTGKIISTIFENVPVSDHKIVITKFRNKVEKGQGVYVFDNSLLEDTFLYRVHMT